VLSDPKEACVALQLRPGCERCDADLAPDRQGAWICSFECTFCDACAGELEGRCPNCGGELARRPTRSAALLEKFPASTERVFRGRS
jgi:hypothetical protein